MIDHAQNLLLRLGPLQLVPHRNSFSVHHLHGVQALRESPQGLPHLAEVHVPHVPTPQPPRQPELVQPHPAFLQPEPPHGLPCHVVGLVGLSTVGGVCGGRGRGTNGDTAAAAAAAMAAEAQVAHPAPSGVRHGYGGAAAVVVGFISGCGDGRGHGGCRITCTWERIV